MRLRLRRSCPWLLVLPVLLNGLAAAAPAPGSTDSGGAPPVDPELEMLKQSLVPKEVAGVDKAVGGLARLPRYRIDAELRPDARELIGTEQILYPVDLPPEARALGELYLRVPANAPHLQRGGAPAVRLLRVESRQTAVTLQSHDNGVFRLSFEPAVPSGVTLDLEIAFRASIPQLPGTDNAQSLLMQQAMSLMGGGSTAAAGTDHGAFGWSGEHFNLAGFYPEVTKREGAGFDTSEEPGQGEPRWGPVANYTVSLVAPDGWQVAGSGLEIGRTPERDGRTRSTRVMAAARGVALVAGKDLVRLEAMAGPVKVLVWSARDDELQRRKMLDAARRALEFYSGRFGAYPWATLEVSAMPLTGGADCLSWPGLVGCSALVTDEDTGAALQAFAADGADLADRGLELSVAHQVAHQWWGGLVGSDRREHPELDEPLASHSALMYLEHRRGAAKGRQMAEKLFKPAYGFHRMLGGADQPVARPITEYRGRGEIEGLLRGKGAMGFEALRRLVGDKAFFDALRRYARTHRFREVEADGVVVELAAVAPARAQAALRLYDRYMRQTFGDVDIGGPDQAFSRMANGAGLDAQSRAFFEQALQALQGMGVDAAGILGGAIPGLPGAPPSPARKPPSTRKPRPPTPPDDAEPADPQQTP